MSVITKKTTYVRENIIFLIGCALIIFFGFLHITEVYQPSIIYDEYGYWNAGAYIAGLDWSGISFISTYYSFGYGFILAPLLKFVADGILRYRIAIGINVIMYLIAYALSIRFMKRVTGGCKDKKWICFWATVIAMYSANLYDVATTMSEAILYCFYWIFLNVVYRYLKSDKTGWLILSLILCLGLYVIHQRSIGIAVAYVLLLGYRMICNRKVAIQKILPAVAILIVSFMVAVVIKKGLINDIYAWKNLTTAGVNDYSGQTRKIANLFTWGGIKQFITSLSGKVFYLVVASCGLVAWGCACAGRKIYSGLKSKEYDTEYFVMTLVLLSAVCMLGVNNVFMYQVMRIDTLFYGRYSEFAFVPLMLLGGVYIADFAKNKVPVATALVLIGGCAVLFKNRLSACKSYQVMQSSGISMFYLRNTDQFALHACIIFGVVCVLLSYIIAKKSSKKILCLLGIGMVIYWTISATKSLDEDYLFGQKRASNIKQFADIICDYGEDLPIYFVYDEDTYESRDIFGVQYYLKDSTIQAISQEDVRQLDGEYILFVEKDEDVDYDTYMIVRQAAEMVMLVPKDSSVGEYMADANPDAIYDITSISRDLNQIGKEAYECTSNHTEGFVAACQYLTLEPGNYEITYEISSVDNDSTDIGWTDICLDYGGDVRGAEEVILPDRADTDNYVIRKYITLDREAHNVEIRLGSNGNSNITIKKITYRKID